MIALIALCLVSTQAPSRPIVLGPDDKPAFAAPPAGFDQPRESAPKGKVAEVEYESKSVGVKRKMIVYTAEL